MMKRFLILSLTMILALSAWGQTAQREVVKTYDFNWSDATKENLYFATFWRVKSNVYYHENSLNDAPFVVFETDIASGLKFTAAKTQLAYRSEGLFINKNNSETSINLPELSQGNIIEISSKGGTAGQYLTPTVDLSDDGIQVVENSLPDESTANTQTYKYVVKATSGTYSLKAKLSSSSLTGIVYVKVYASSEEGATVLYNWNFQNMLTDNQKSKIPSENVEWSFGSNRYYKDFGTNAAATTNGTAISELDGMTFTTTADKQIRLTVSSTNALFLVRNTGASVTIPIAKAGSRVTIVASQSGIADAAASNPITPTTTNNGKTSVFDIPNADSFSFKNGNGSNDMSITSVTIEGPLYATVSDGTLANGSLSFESVGNTVTNVTNGFYSGSTITINATPAEGYVLESLSGTYYQDADHTAAALTIENNTFTMPSTGDVTITASFKKIQYKLTKSVSNGSLTLKYTNDEGEEINTGDSGIDLDWGTTIYVSASPSSEDYYLSSLTYGETALENNSTFSMPSSATEVTATFTAKNTPAVTKVADFTYDGQSHNLVTATAYDATLSYSYKVGDGNFSEWSGTIPSATNVGTYTVKWKATGGTQSKSVEETTLDAVIVSKATPTITTAPTASAITVGQTLASSTLSGGEASVEGSFAWTNSTIIPAVSDSQTTNYEVTFTPTDTDNYNTATTNVKLTVNSASFTPSVSITGWTYGETPNTPSVEGNTSGGEITYTYYTDSNLSVQTTTENSGAVSEGAVPVNAGTYYVNATIAANGIYGVATASTNFTIAKATPTITTPPTASAINEGQTLANSTLSNGVATVEGTFSWTDNTLTPSVSDSQTTPYNVTFTPTDYANYNTATMTITLTVTAANVVTSLTAFVGTKTFTSDANANWTETTKNIAIYTSTTNPQFMALSRADAMNVNSTYGLRLGKSENGSGGALVFYVGSTSDITINIKQVQATDTSDNPLMVDYMGNSFEALTTSNYATAGTNKASGTLTSSNTTLQLMVSSAQAGYYKVYSSTYRFGVTSLTITPIHSVTAVTSTGTDTYGTVVTESTMVAEGATTIITATPATGYQVANWAVSGTGASIDPSENSNSITTTLTMGTADATVTCTFEPINYDITVTQPASGGTFTVKVGDADAVSANTTANYNQTITLANTPNNGFVLSSYSVIKTASSESINVSNGQFTMPAETVTVTATFVNNTSAESTFTISSLLSNGTITATVDEAVVNSGSSVAEGKSVVLTVTPEEGYHLKTGTLKYTYNDGEDHDVAIDETTKTFIMPAYAVTVSATFEADSSEPAGTAVVHMCGDSMMSIYGNQSNDESATTTYNQGMRGWGQYFGDYVNLTVQDWAHTGTTAKGFYTGANYWKVVMGTNQMTDAYKLERPYVVDFEAVKAGDYVIMCWGHNDQKGGTLHNGYKTLEESEYITYITTMVNEVRDKGAYPILATSICRALFSGKNLTRLGKIDACEAAGETHTDSNDPYNYPEAMRKLANDLNVPLIDLNQASQTLWEDFGPGLTASVFFEGVGTTHTAEAGARAMGIAANLIIRDWDTSDAKYANYAALRAAMKTDVEQYKKSDYAARETTVATETTWTFEKSADGETTYSSSDVIANALVDFNGLYLRANESHTLNAQGVSGSFTFSNEKQVSWTMGLISSAMSSSPCSDASTAGMGVTTSSDRCVAINISGPGTFYVAMRTKGDPTSGRLFNLAFDGTIVDSKASSKNVVELKYKANKAGVFYVWGTEGYIIVAAHYVPTADTSEAEMHEQTERNLGVTLDGIQKWATYFSDINLAIPAGVTAYRVASVNGNTVNVEEVDYIKANRGVLLYSETAVDPEDLIVGAGSGTDYTSELLGSTSAGSMTSGTNYVLYNNQFILAEDTTLPANRCYIHLSGSATSRGLTIVPGNGNTTGIEDIPKDEGKQTKDQYYNMNGQRIDKPTKKGLYIVNGRKVVIK